MEEDAATRRLRKEEGKRLKKQRIEAAGGKRPRTDENEVKKSFSPKRKIVRNRNTPTEHNQRSNRFGRVMDQVPCRNEPRGHTVSIAVPGSIMTNCQTRELRTLMAGQIARAATIYHVDEIVVFDDKLSKKSSNGRYQGNRDRGSFDRNRFDRNRNHEQETAKEKDEEQESAENDATTEPDRPRASKDPHAFLARVLQYCECPQYLRKAFFPQHPDLQFSGLLAPIDSAHHVRADDRCEFREGVVLDKTDGDKSLVNCGIRFRPVRVAQKLQPGIRCTIQLNPADYGRPGQLTGNVVSPNTVTKKNGTYWGYTVRMATSLKAVIDECPYYGEKYDLTIGTSERGTEDIDDANFSAHKRASSSNSSFKHALIVFGGVAGIEECVDADETMKISGAKSSTLFDKWINVCRYQGSRTIRTEEAILITLAKLSPFLAASSGSSSHKQTGSSNNKDDSSKIQACLRIDEGKNISDESSSSDED